MHGHIGHDLWPVCGPSALILGVTLATQGKTLKGPHKAMSYLVKFADGKWARLGKPVPRICNATIYPHPSSAKHILRTNVGAQLVPFATVKDEWLASRDALADGHAQLPPLES